MREIKFRGKEHTGDWITGGFVQKRGVPHIVAHIVDRGVDEWRAIPVIPATVGQFTGLRDGEKLYEEVLNDQETTLPTFHPKIKIARVREYDYGEVCRQVDELVRSAATESDMEIVRRMKAMVPEFKSQHSVYEALDK